MINDTIRRLEHIITSACRNLHTCHSCSPVVLTRTFVVAHAAFPVSMQGRMHCGRKQQCHKHSSSTYDSLYRQHEMRRLLQSHPFSPHLQSFGQGRGPSQIHHCGECRSVYQLRFVCTAGSCARTARLQLAGVLDNAPYVRCSQ
jgi:hypothetical protein